MPDEPKHRSAHAICQQQWAAALASYERAALSYRPIRSAFERTERRYFSSKKRGEAPEEITQREIELDEATDDEHRFGIALYATARALLCTPAPDLAGAIRKLELMRDLDWDEDSVPILLADLNRLQARHVDGGQQ